MLQMTYDYGINEDRPSYGIKTKDSKGRPFFDHDEENLKIFRTLEGAKAYYAAQSEAYQSCHWIEEV